MTNIELLSSIIEDIKQLPYRDGDKLDGIRRRYEMIVGKVFGVSSKYVKDIADIEFHPMFYPAPETVKGELWESGKTRFINLINVLIEELELTQNTNVETIPRNDVRQDLSSRIFITLWSEVVFRLTSAVFTFGFRKCSDACIRNSGGRSRR